VETAEIVSDYSHIDISRGVKRRTDAQLKRPKSFLMRSGPGKEVPDGDHRTNGAVCQKPSVVSDEPADPGPTRR
jgi:hypothetical protein